ncbi:hypothetical protein CSOJ01_05825 [Colletotrichum sojae]|uniref:Uncharacterized protein n=1 Tax=Colletotrichum sojae TaxID=2175907 RepID=A0A8H6JE38_9PEZI|nr:hypothetical protein CSOJ01_05825 [Colletotrichum sojae]
MQQSSSFREGDILPEIKPSEDQQRNRGVLGRERGARHAERWEIRAAQCVVTAVLPSPLDPVRQHCLIFVRSDNDLFLTLRMPFPGMGLFGVDETSPVSEWNRRGKEGMPGRALGRARQRAGEEHASFWDRSSPFNRSLLARAPGRDVESLMPEREREVDDSLVRKPRRFDDGSIGEVPTEPTSQASSFDSGPASSALIAGRPALERVEEEWLVGVLLDAHLEFPGDRSGWPRRPRTVPAFAEHQRCCIVGNNNTLWSGGGAILGGLEPREGVAAEPAESAEGLEGLRSGDVRRAWRRRAE